MITFLTMHAEGRADFIVYNMTNTMSLHTCILVILYYLAQLSMYNHKAVTNLLNSLPKQLIIIVLVEIPVQYLI